jgi:hypothetical protein
VRCGHWQLAGEGGWWDQELGRLEASGTGAGVAAVCGTMKHDLGRPIRCHSDLAAASLLLGKEANGNTAGLSPWRELGTGKVDGGERREACEEARGGRA